MSEKKKVSVSFMDNIIPEVIVRYFKDAKDFKYKFKEAILKGNVITKKTSSISKRIIKQILINNKELQELFTKLSLKVISNDLKSAWTQGKGGLKNPKNKERIEVLINALNNPTDATRDIINQILDIFDTFVETVEPVVRKKGSGRPKKIQPIKDAPLPSMPRPSIPRPSRAEEPLSPVTQIVSEIKEAVDVIRGPRPQVERTLKSKEGLTTQEARAKQQQAIQEVQVPVLAQQPVQPVQPQPIRPVGVDFKEASEIANEIQNNVYNIGEDRIEDIRNLLQGLTNVESFIANSSRNAIVNVLAGLAIYSRIPNVAKSRAGLATGIALSLAGAYNTLKPKEAREDLDESRRQLKQKKITKAIKKPDIVKPKAPPVDLISRLLQEAKENLTPEVEARMEQRGINVDENLRILNNVAQEGGRFDIIERLKSSGSALGFLTFLANLPTVGQEIKQLSRDIASSGPPTGRPVPSPAGTPSPSQVEPSPSPAPTPSPTEPPEVPVPLPLPPSFLFTPRKIETFQQDTKEEQKSNQIAKPNYIVPSVSVLDPENQKEEFDIQAGFDFDIPFAMNGVVLEDNPLMQQHRMEEMIRYSGGGIWVGNEDWNDPTKVAFEKPVNEDILPRMVFNEDYEDMPYNPNVTMETNIAYNDFTNIRPTDPQANSLRQSTLLGRQP